LKVIEPLTDRLLTSIAAPGHVAASEADAAALLMQAPANLQVPTTSPPHGSTCAQ
jgi:hypothetical protein